MKDYFDLESIGKRMPYNTPACHLDELEHNVLSRLNMPTKPLRKRSTFRRLVIPASGTLVAASIAAVIFFRTDRQPEQNSNSKAQAAPVKIEQVDRAFYNLNASDREYLLSVYQNDIFMTE